MSQQQHAASLTAAPHSPPPAAYSQTTDTQRDVSITSQIQRPGRIYALETQKLSSSYII